MRTTVRLRIVLHVTHEKSITREHMAVALHRAESIASRVLLCGDTGGALSITDGARVGGGIAVDPCADAITTGAGEVTRSAAKR